MKRSVMNPAWLCLLLCGAGLLCSGCINRTSKATYPDAWSPANVVPASECPNLAGRYANAGEVAPGATEFWCGRHGPYLGEWCHETTLSQNIGGLVSADWVELRQPDKDTLVVVSSDPTVAVKELHRQKGEFSCSAKGLERQIHASFMSRGNNADESSAAGDTLNATSTAFGMVMGSGGVRTLTRRFAKASDGSLVMAVSQSQTGALFLIPFHEDGETFVRWTPVTPPSGEARATPALAAAVDPPPDLPSAHVGIFEATNGKMWSKVKVTNLDGSPVNTYAGYPGVPIAMEPGRHWVQVEALTTHLIPLRDVDTRYAFEMDAVAGHRYRIPDKPSSCVATGDIDAALASASIYHARLSVIDEAPGLPGRTFDVQALCVSARTYVCVPPKAVGDEPVGGLRCVRLEGWGWGYYGKDAGAVPAH